MNAMLFLGHPFAPRGMLHLFYRHPTYRVFLRRTLLLTVQNANGIFFQDYLFKHQNITLPTQTELPPGLPVLSPSQAQQFGPQQKKMFRHSYLILKEGRLRIQKEPTDIVLGVLINPPSYPMKLEYVQSSRINFLVFLLKLGLFLSCLKVLSEYAVYTLNQMDQIDKDIGKNARLYQFLSILSKSRRGKQYKSLDQQ